MAAVVAAEDALAALARRPVREFAVLAALAVATAFAFVLAVGLGSVRIAPGEVIAILLGDTPTRASFATIVHDVRLPRALTALLAGGALGVAGLQMQTLLRNPLADPFVLGISSGASLGVALVVLGGGGAAAAVFAGGLGIGGDALLTLAAIAGALLVLGPALALSARLAGPATVLVVGLMFGYAVQSFVTILVAGASPERLQRWIAWGFGSFGGVTWDKVPVFAPPLVLGIVVAAATVKPLNAMLLGETYARSMGVDARAMRIATMAGASVLAGVVTAFCGPIAFLGVAVPHLARGLTGTSDHRILVPAVILLGGVLALAAQVVALLPGSAGTLPLNAVTSLIGAPVVIAVILRARKGAFAA